MTVRIDDNSNWGVVAGKLNNISSSSSGTAKTSDALDMGWTIAEASCGRCFVGVILLLLYVYFSPLQPPPSKLGSYMRCTGLIPNVC